MPSRYRHDYAAFDREVLCADWMVAEMAARAEKVLARAVETAPVDVDGKHPGLYKASMKTESGIKTSANGHKRAYGRVSNDAPYAVFVEFGGKATPRHRTLGNALDAAKE